MQSHKKLTYGLIITIQNGTFPPCRDPSLPHPERQDHLQQPERLRGGDGRPDRQRSGGGRGGTEGRPEDRHPISGQRLLQRLQLQLHQWEHTPAHCFFSTLLQCLLFLHRSASAEKGLMNIYCRPWPILHSTGRVYSRLIELWAVFITDVGWKVVFSVSCVRLCLTFIIPTLDQNPNRHALNLQPCGGEIWFIVWPLRRNRCGNPWFYLAEVHWVIALWKHAQLSSLEYLATIKCRRNWRTQLVFVWISLLFTQQTLFCFPSPVLLL